MILPKQEGGRHKIQVKGGPSQEEKGPLGKGKSQEVSRASATKATSPDYSRQVKMRQKSPREHFIKKMKLINYLMHLNKELRRDLENCRSALG